MKDALEKRKKNNSLRELPKEIERIDFCSNDYLGFANNNLPLKDILLGKNMREYRLSFAFR